MCQINSFIHEYQTLKINHFHPISQRINKQTDVRANLA